MKYCDLYSELIINFTAFADCNACCKYYLINSELITHFEIYDIMHVIQYNEY